MSETVVRVGGTTYRRESDTGAWREDDHAQPEFSYGVASGVWKFLDALATARANALREAAERLDRAAQSYDNDVDRDAQQVVLMCRNLVLALVAA